MKVIIETDGGLVVDSFHVQDVTTMSHPDLGQRFTDWLVRTVNRAKLREEKVNGQRQSV